MFATKHVALRLALGRLMRVEVLGGVERRWSRDDKMRIIEETLMPGFPPVRTALSD
jgi:transposase